MKHLHKIRTPGVPGPLNRRVLATVGILLAGIFLGTFSKFLDHRQAELPALLRTVDDALNFHNFLGGFAPWIVMGLWISADSRTPVRAAVNVFAFFTGFVAGYYLYGYFAAGFFPRSYALVWAAFTAASPFLGFLSWYAKGKGSAALVLSAGILGVLLNTAFSYGLFYLHVRSWMNLLMLLWGVLLLRKSPKDTAVMLVLSIPIAIVLKLVIPFSLG